LPEHHFLGETTVTVLDISASPGALTPIVPDRCELVVDRRFLPEETEDGLLDGFRKFFLKIKAQDPEFEADVASIKWFPAMFTDPDEPIVKAMLRARERVLGAPGELGAWYFGVDGTFLNRAGIPCVGLGPGNEYLAHTPKDVVPVRELVDATRIYATLIQDVCG
jgi:succinyl-diaminopimelate desuccinylase